jgi:hypothetical protein
VKQRNDGVTAVGQGPGQFAAKQAAGTGEEDAQRMVHALGNVTASFWVRAARGDRNLVIGDVFREIGPCGTDTVSIRMCAVGAERNSRYLAL